jgi:membrane protein YqaA with SNARE-associated domain
MNHFIQNTTSHHGHGFTSAFRRFGALGLFVLAILDSTPMPTFAGTDILTAILAGTHYNPWYEYAAVAAAGSVIGAYLTFRVARRAGWAYLETSFRRRGLPAMLSLFERWGTSTLAISTGVPLPFPTGLFFAAAGASHYRTGKFLTVVTLCRAVRYAVIAIIADYYGRHFVHALRHPRENWEWWLLFSALLFSIIVAGILLSSRLAATSRAQRGFFSSALLILQGVYTRLLYPSRSPGGGLGERLHLEWANRQCVREGRGGGDADVVGGDGAAHRRSERLSHISSRAKPE